VLDEAIFRKQIRGDFVFGRHILEIFRLYK